MQEREQYGKLVELSKARDHAQNALQVHALLATVDMRLPVL